MSLSHRVLMGKIPYDDIKHEILMDAGGYYGTYSKIRRTVHIVLSDLTLERFHLPPDEFRERLFRDKDQALWYLYSLMERDESEGRYDWEYELDFIRYNCVDCSNLEYGMCALTKKKETCTGNCKNRVPVYKKKDTQN